MIGDDSLVPPHCAQLEFLLLFGETVLSPPLFGSAAAETSAIARLAHPVLTVDGATAVFTVEQPEPAPLHAVSLMRLGFVPVVIFSVVPPTAVTLLDDAGNDAPW